ncbi:hypothetical protein Ssi03_37690 [Sphaerisporangium siamense]|uniref:ParB/Sulfiredoxin domain-containing protein n=1 Tax=Sphaerisporangium siamense TaxID=795645 RepID=A0A7W7D860_9ACTN|nr:DUF6551 family protein [Sphaerisporangium siamense]MBB4701075.1 hypothetical protein [Sphaerisporangium siamense]GII85779.1 hypothetical protein Ssi03_37690 [Sphaerisporangium siamense]
MTKQRIPIDYQLPEHRVILDGGAAVARLEPWEHASHPVDQVRTKHLAATLQQAALGVLVVSQRADGSRRVLDGIHRLAACKLRGARTVPAEIHHGLNERAEAALYLLKHREARRLSGPQEYRAGVAAGLRPYTETARVLQARNLQVGEPADDRLSAITSLLRITHDHGPGVLDQALGVAERAWGREADTWDYTLIGGLATFLAHHPEAVELSHLSRLLSRRGNASRWRSEVVVMSSRAGFNSDFGFSRETMAYQLIVSICNQGRRARNRIEPVA